MTAVQAANLMAISVWYGNLMLQAKSSTARKRREPELLAKQKRWMDGQQMLQIAHQFLLEGWHPCQTAWITSLHVNQANDDDELFMFPCHQVLPCLSGYSGRISLADRP